jgi:sphingomyelin phosphodiesterase
MMSDLHIDFDYTPGKSNVCGETVCCRSTTIDPVKPEDAAGYWGDFSHCDLPKRTLENFLTYVKNEIKPDVVIWTGDSLPHNVED